MDKLFLVLVIALFANCILGQEEQNNNNIGDLEDRYGFNNNNNGNNRFPGHNRRPGNNWRPGNNRNPGWNTGNNMNPGGQQTTTTQAPGSTTQSPELRQCLASCPSTSEYNPVCGTDGVTYDNPGKLACAQYCKVDVTMRRTSRCTTPNQ